jgi:hypothetical protein
MIVVLSGGSGRGNVGLYTNESGHSNKQLKKRAADHSRTWSHLSALKYNLISVQLMGVFLHVK